MKKSEAGSAAIEGGGDESEASESATATEEEEANDAGVRRRYWNICVQWHRHRWLVIGQQRFVLVFV